MGYSLSWVAIKGANLSDVLHELQMEQTNIPGEQYRGGPSCYLDMNNGWHLITFDWQDLVRDPDPIIKQLSMLGEVVAVSIHEGGMVSAAGGWEKGSRKWLVSHELDLGQTDLETSGELPSCFDSVSSQLKDEAEENDFDCDYYFDIPVQVGFRIVGFIHDRVVEGLNTDAFTELQPIEKKAKIT